MTKTAPIQDSTSNLKAISTKRRYSASNPEKRRETLRKYNASDKHKASYRKWYRSGGAKKIHTYKQKNRKKYLEYFKKYNLARAEQKRERSRRWYAEHKEQAKEAFRQARPRRNAIRRSRMKTDIQFRLSNCLRGRIAAAIRVQAARKGGTTEQLLGCTVSEVRAYLESKFLPGMSWDNRFLWHIDHIKPCCSFDLADLEQQKQCFSYTNLQPLWARDNMVKHTKWQEQESEKAA